MNEPEALAYHRVKYGTHTFNVYTIEEYDRIYPIAASLNAKIITNRNVRNELSARRERECIVELSYRDNREAVKAKERVKYKGGYKVNIHGNLKTIINKIR